MREDIIRLKVNILDYGRGPSLEVRKLAFGMDVHHTLLPGEQFQEEDLMAMAEFAHTTIASRKESKDGS